MSMVVNNNINPRNEMTNEQNEYENMKAEMALRLKEMKHFFRDMEVIHKKYYPKEMGEE